MAYNETATPGDANAVNTPSAQPEAELYACLKEWFCADREHSSKWRAEAKEDFDFLAGRQWGMADEAKLREQGRPTITFNRVLPMVKSVCGIEINGRTETTFLPRNNNAAEVQANEVLSGADKWMSDECDAEDEQSEAFGGTCACGMGWTEQRMDYDEDPQGKYCEEEVDPLQMYWDRAARKKNLVDAKRIFRVKKMTLSEARDLVKSMGLSVDDQDLNCEWAGGLSQTTDKDEKTVEEKRDRSDENAVEYDPKSIVHLVHAQWIEKKSYFKVVVPSQDPTQQAQLVDMTPDQHNMVQVAAKKMGQTVRSTSLQRKVYKQALLGAIILGGVKPTASRAGYTYACITGERDRNQGTWFGLIRSMRDPQMWANKWMSQTLHIMNSTALGGIMAERGAFKDIQEAQENWASPDSIAELNEGGLQKIAPKPGQGLPANHQAMTEFAIQALPQVTGLNMELMGLREVDQPGVLEAQRKQAAMTILATLFDSQRRFKKLVGRTRLCFIQDYLSDGRLIRITKPDGNMQFMPLIRDKTAGEYEVIIDDAPSAPNEKGATWGAIQQLMPVLMPLMQQSPEAAMATLDYLPLPSRLVNVYKSAIQQTLQQQAQQAQQPQDPKTQIMLATGAANIEALKAKANKDNAIADATHADATSKTIQTVHSLQHPDIKLTNGANK